MAYQRLTSGETEGPCPRICPLWNRAKAGSVVDAQATLRHVVRATHVKAHGLWVRIEAEHKAGRERYAVGDRAGATAHLRYAKTLSAKREHLLGVYNNARQLLDTLQDASSTAEIARIMGEASGQLGRLLEQTSPAEMEELIEALSDQSAEVDEANAALAAPIAAEAEVDEAELERLFGADAPAPREAVLSQPNQHRPRRAAAAE